MFAPFESVPPPRRVPEERHPTDEGLDAVVILTSVGLRLPLPLDAALRGDDPESAHPTGTSG